MSVLTVAGQPVKTTLCKSCLRRIVWASTRNARTGKTGSMPVDADPAPTGNVELVFEHNLLYAVVLGQPSLLSTELRHSHMETCPKRDQWRKRRR
jgi:hypothetical protein